MRKAPSINTVTDIRNFRKKAPFPKPLMAGVIGCKGLSVFIYPNTDKTVFRLNVIHPDGKTKTNKTIGTFDDDFKTDLTVEQARTKAEIVRAEVLTDVDHKIKSAGGALTPLSPYREVAKSWFQDYLANHKKGGATKIKHEGCLNKIYGSHLADLPFGKVDRFEIIPFLKQVEASTPKGSQGENVRKTMGLINSYAESTIRGAVYVNLKGTTKYDDTNPNNRPQLPVDCRPNYQLCDKIQSKLMRLACKLAHHTFLRSGELTTHFERDPTTKKVLAVLSAEWSEIDFKESVWIVPGPRMKKKITHLVPLSKQSINILNEIKRLTSHIKDLKYIFPNMLTPEIPIDENLLANTFRNNKIGYRPMDCRKLAGDWLKNNSTDRYTVEVQLAHKQGDKVENAYVISSLYYQLAERRIAMQKWSDYLESKSQEKENELLDKIRSIEGVQSVQSINIP